MVDIAAQGYVANRDSTYATAYVDAMEYVPDLAFPESVSTYTKMRRDPQVQAVIGAVTLPIRRAQASLDPNGCDPVKVRLLSDWVGVPVAGDDTPGAFRRRGVVWPQHLRMAMLREVYGFMPFELEAADDGTHTVLTGLYERLPQTVQNIGFNEATGALEWLQQFTKAGERDSRKIDASRLCWYVREREGANWTGVSLLRASFGPWLLKHEMWRVHGISNRRNGAGIPVNEALPGTSPTDDQMRAAAQMAQAARAGDIAGASSPPGFTLKFKGVEGALPNTLDFIRYLDQQISRSALAGMLDLGDTPNGSRALGSEFVDLFMLSEQAAADEYAETFTRDVLVRAVDWNWGEDEPCPRLVISSVGADTQVTAESIGMLLDSGALTTDPALEAYLRRRFALPERDDEEAPQGKSFGYDLDYGVMTVDERRAQIGLPPHPDPEVGNSVPLPASARIQAPVASDMTAEVQARVDTERRRRGLHPAKVAAAGAPRADTGKDVRLRRQPNAVEAKAGTDFQAVHTQWVDALDELVAAYVKVQTAQSASLVSQVKAAVTDADLDALAAMSVDTDAATALLDKHMKSLATEAAATMRKEAAAQGVSVPSTAIDADRIGRYARVQAEVLANGLRSSATRQALQAWGSTSSSAKVGKAVAEHLGSLSDSALRDALGQTLTAAQSEGRMAVMKEAPAAVTYAASEIMDVNTCEACVDVDGTTYASLEDADADYANGGYADCLGGARCRGILVAVWSK